MAEYEKIKRITIPLKGGSDRLLVITTEVIADHQKIIDSVFRMINS